MKIKSNFKRRDFLTLGGIAFFLPMTSPLKAFTSELSGINVGRRVVTGLNSEGKSIIVSDGFVPDNARWTDPEIGSGNNLWIENQVPVDLNDKTDPIIGYSPTIEPPLGGVKVAIGTWIPGFIVPKHSTATIDFVFIISGKLEMILDDGSTILAPGDTVIQRGTNHGFRVVGDEPCTLAALLVSASNKQ